MLRFRFCSADAAVLMTARIAEPFLQRLTRLLLVRLLLGLFVPVSRQTETLLNKVGAFEIKANFLKIERGFVQVNVEILRNG